MTQEDEILVGCEIGCLTGDLIACPLSDEEQCACTKRLEYYSRKRDQAWEEFERQVKEDSEIAENMRNVWGYQRQGAE